MNSISEFYKTIFKNFFCCSVVYLPSSLMREFEEVKESGNEFDFLEHSDTVFIINRDGQNLLPEGGGAMKHVTGKKLLLEENLFLLLRKREGCLPITFDYMFGKYCQQLLVYLWLAEWLEGNLQEHIKNLDKNTERSFAEQCKILTSHKSELEKHFRDQLARLDPKTRIHFVPGTIPRPEAAKTIEQIKKAMPPNSVKETNKRKKDKLSELKEFTNGYAPELIFERVFNKNDQD